MFLLLISASVTGRWGYLFRMTVSFMLSWVLVHLFTWLLSLLLHSQDLWPNSCLLETPQGSLWNTDRCTNPAHSPSARRRIFCPAGPQLRPATQTQREACAWGLSIGSSFSLCNRQGLKLCLLQWNKWWKPNGAFTACLKAHGNTSCKAGRASSVNFWREEKQKVASQHDRKLKQEKTSYQGRKYLKHCSDWSLACGSLFRWTRTSASLSSAYEDTRQVCY